MKRFSKLFPRGTCQNIDEISFLQRYSEIPSSVTTKPEQAIISEGESKPSKPIGTARGIKTLMTLIHQRRYTEAEQLFSQVPRLSERPAAIRMLIKLYCEQTDFISARAILLRSLEHVGDKGCASFIAHAVFTARNSRLVEDIFAKIFNMHLQAGTEVDTRLLATVLNGLLFLNNLDAFQRVWNLVSQKCKDPYDNYLTCQSMVLKFLIQENWNAASYWWQVSVQKKSNKVHKIQAKSESIWYLACRFYLSETPNTGNLDKVLLLMSQSDVSPSFQLTAMLLYHLSSVQPFKTTLDWLEYARDMGWPLNSQCALTILSPKWSRRFPENVSNRLNKFTLNQLSIAGQTAERKLLAMGNDGFSNTWFKRIKQCKTDSEVLSTLNLMQRQGLVLSYSICVLAFETALSLAPAHDVSQTIDSMCSILKNMGYPLHCAGIDLSVVEVHCRLTGFNRDVCNRLISQYLAQYPLLNNSLSQLTRLAVLLMNCNDYEAAYRIIDSLRTSQPDVAGNFRFSSQNHDGISLQIMADCKFRMGHSLVPFLQSIIDDDPRIYFDDTFLRKLRRLLKLTGENKDILKQFYECNTQAVNAAEKEIRESLRFVHNI